MIQVSNDIKTICNELLQRYKDEVKKSGHDASGKLVGTASYKCTFNGKWFELTFQLEDYWKYLENGTRPHFPPTDAIERWITVKRIVPSTINGRVPTTKQLAYLIAREISIKGTKATKMLQKTINSSDDLINELCDILAQQIEKEIDKDI